MKRAVIFGLLVVLLGVAQALRPRLMPAAQTVFEVDADVKLVPKAGAEPTNDGSSVVIWLVPDDPRAVLPTDAHPRIYRMVQHDKKFDPGLLVVPQGSLVVFPNLDPWFHNVFSLYRGARFDLGLYQAGDAKSVRFDRLGPSYIFCNIHPQMAAVILTVDSPYYGLSRRSGHISIPDVPPGAYFMHVWYENADPGTLEKLSSEVVVGDGGRSLPAISIQVTPHDLRAHKNKYGSNYDTETLGSTY